MLTDIDTHPLLSAKARGIEPHILAEVALVAADLLGLSEHADLIAGSESVSKAQRAVALQINLQVERGIEAEAYTREVVDGYTKEYRDSLTSGYALMLAEEVLMAIGAYVRQSAEYGVIRTRR